MGLKILCAADIHLGRRTSRLPEDFDARRCSPEAAWERLVQRALDTAPDAVLLAGDLVDQDNRFYEAYGPLESGIRRMIDAGIPVVAVAGNHDWQVLPRLADQIEGFSLLGRAGKWEERSIDKDGKTLFRVRGFSFHAQHIQKNLFNDYSFGPGGDAPVVGLIHCDLDMPGSVYAPISTAQLATTDALAWICGHTHAPRVYRNENPMIFYCGSPQGLDPTEAGLHGAWEITIDNARRIETEHIALSGLRWEAADISVDDVIDRESFDHALITGLNDLHAKIVAELGPAYAVGCRFRLTGRSPIHRQIRAWIQSDDVGGLKPINDGIQYFIEKISDDAAPKIDLAEEAKGTSPPAMLAAKILTLRDKTPADEYSRLITQGRKRIEAAINKPYYSGIESGNKPGDETIRDFLMRAGFSALESLLAQKEADA